MNTKERPPYFARLMRRTMNRNNLSVDELSAMVGISRVSLYRYIHGDRYPKLNHAAKIADTLGFASTRLSAFVVG